MPNMLSVTEYNHKIYSKNHKLCTVKMKYQSPQKMAKNTKYFFPEGAYAQHKRRTYNLKGPRAARTCLVTLKRGLLTIQLVGFRGAAQPATIVRKYFLDHYPVHSQLCITKVPIKILAIFPLESSSIISISYLILTTPKSRQGKQKTRKRLLILIATNNWLGKLQIQASAGLKKNLMITAKRCELLFILLGITGPNYLVQ